MKIPIKAFVLSILEEKELPKMTVTKQQSKPYNELVGKTNKSRVFLLRTMVNFKKFFIKVDNQNLQNLLEVLYKIK